uniref:Uncharacterized protein n=1 Tax=Magallana gigas TaxID=29159 RepID=K1QYX4_MAGGI
MARRPVSFDRWTTIIVIVLTNPYCSSAIKCQPPSLKYPLQMTTYKQIFRYNESIEFHCAANYHIQGEAVRYCTHNDSFQQNLPTCSANRAQDTQQSITVAILAGCAIGLVVFSSATIVIIITRRQLRKQKENVNYEEGICQSEDKDHDYTGIKQQSYANKASYVVTEETPDNRDHQYTELKNPYPITWVRVFFNTTSVTLVKTVPPSNGNFRAFPADLHLSKKLSNFPQTMESWFTHAHILVIMHGFVI